LTMLFPSLFVILSAFVTIRVLSGL
jgi:hypothetical protein